MFSPYYSPEKYGLTTAGEVDFSTGCYEFDITAVWRDHTGRLLWADDSGCSCPCPFEDIGIDDMITGSFFDLANHLHERVEQNAGGWGNQNAGADVVTLLSRVRDLPPVEREDVAA